LTEQSSSFNSQVSSQSATSEKVSIGIFFQRVHLVALSACV
jgi:hypothetical protein